MHNKQIQPILKTQKQIPEEEKVWQEEIMVSFDVI